MGNKLGNISITYRSTEVIYKMTSRLSRIHIWMPQRCANLGVGKQTQTIIVIKICFGKKSIWARSLGWRETCLPGRKKIEK